MQFQCTVLTPVTSNVRARKKVVRQQLRESRDSVNKASFQHLLEHPFLLGFAPADRRHVLDLVQWQARPRHVSAAVTLWKLLRHAATPQPLCAAIRACPRHALHFAAEVANR